MINFLIGLLLVALTIVTVIFVCCSPEQTEDYDLDDNDGSLKVKE